MTNYGQTIREIRLNKGFSQKEIYTGIVSKSYAIEFEKGHHEMSITSFLKVINRLFMNFDEFEFIHNGYQQKEHSVLHKRHANAANTGDLPKLNKLLAEISAEKSEMMLLLKARIHLDIFAIEHLADWELADVPKKDVEFIRNYLMRLSSWSLEEIALFANTSFYFSFDVREVLMESAMKSIKKYKDFHAYKNIATGLLINFIGNALFNRKKRLVEKYLIELDVLTQDLFFAFQRDSYFYFKGIYQIIWGDKVAGEKTARYMLEHMKLLGYNKQYIDFNNGLIKVLNGQFTLN